MSPRGIRIVPQARGAHTRSTEHANAGQAQPVGPASRNIQQNGKNAVVLSSVSVAKILLRKSVATVLPARWSRR